MTYDKKILGYGNSQHPMHDEEQEITLEHVIGRLTIDEADFLENHMTNLVKDANRKFENAQRIQKEINELEQKKSEFQIDSLGMTKEEKDRIYSDLYVKCELAKEKLNQLLTL